VLGLLAARGTTPERMTELLRSLRIQLVLTAHPTEATRRTLLGLQSGQLMGGAVLTETVFAWPGLGRLMVKAIFARDYVLLQGAVLVFALAQGLFWAGVASTFVMGIGTAITVAVIASIAVGARAWAQHFADARSGYGMLAMRGVEVGAAVVIIAFGALLLTGYMVTERMVGI
jgi:hypothetical protein